MALRSSACILWVKRSDRARQRQFGGGENVELRVPREKIAVEGNEIGPFERRNDVFVLGLRVKRREKPDIVDDEKLLCENAPINGGQQSGGKRRTAVHFAISGIESNVVFERHASLVLHVLIV